jgi:hypothetical protein
MGQDGLSEHDALGWRLLLFLIAYLVLCHHRAKRPDLEVDDPDAECWSCRAPAKLR